MSFPSIPTSIIFEDYMSYVAVGYIFYGIHTIYQHGKLKICDCQVILETIQKFHALHFDKAQNLLERMRLLYHIGI